MKRGLSPTAAQAWEVYGRPLTPDYFEPLCDFVYTRTEEVIRDMIGNAFMRGMMQYPGRSLECFCISF